MESLSIKKTGKVFLAVALVIFMLVALLGLSLYGHAAATASATVAPTITATFTANSATAHSDSTTTKKYYNQLASGTGALPLAVNDTFTVTYVFGGLDTGIFGFNPIPLTQTGFDIVSVTVGSTTLTAGTPAAVNSVYYTFGTTGLLIDGNGALVTSISNVVVVYKLTSAIDTYDHKDISITGNWEGPTGSGNATSAAIGVYVRSTATIANGSAAKTYDSAVATSTSTFTPAVDDSSDTSNRPAIVKEWSADGETYVSAAPFNAGTYYVRATTVANDYYEATSDVDTFTIAQKAVTLTAANKTTEHGDALATLTWTGDSGFYAADGITVSASTTAATTGTNSNVGTYPITLATAASPTSGYAGLANYAITYEHAQTSGDYGVYTITRKFIAVPTVTIFNNGATTGTTIAVAGSEDVNYNGLVYSFDYAAASDNAYSGVASPAASKNVGTYVLTLSVGSNYRWGANVDAVYDVADKVFTYVVKKVDLHVSLDHDAITYRDAVPTTGYSISLPTAAVGGETVDGISLTQANFATAYVQGSPVGTYAITLAADSATDTAIKTAFSNYNVIYDTAAKLSVGKLTITADGTWVAYKSGDSATMTYDAAAHGIAAVATGYTFGGVEICDVALTGGDNSNGTQTHVSGNEAAVTLTATFTLKGDSAEDDYNNVITANYTLAEGVQTKNITITRKAITVTANPKTITYGDAFANDGVTYGTFAGSETSAVLTGTLAYATDYVAEALNAKRVVGTYYIRPSGLSNNDYAISFVDGTLTVEKKVVTFTWSETQSWVYDGASHTISATVVGAEYGETITAAAYSGDASATDVGNYSRTVTSLSDNANYAITDAGTETETYSITKKAITITITPATSLVYTSAEKTVFTVTVSGMIGEETLTYTFDGTNIKEADGTFTLSNASETFTGMLAQSYGLSLTAVANGTGKIGNYEYTLPEAAENTIAKATFTPGAISYSGATVSWAAVTGVQGEDVITFTYTVNKGASEMQSGSGLSYTAAATGDDYVLAISFAGDRAANYNAIADQDLYEVFSVTLADTAFENATYGHPHNGAQIASVTQYAFDGQTVPGVSDWAVAGYDFKGWYVDATDRTSAKFSASNAVTATATYVASWDVVTYNVTYKYKLAGADSWTTWKVDVVTTYYTALQTVPSNKWFSNVGWNDAEAMNGATKTILDYTEDRTYYTVYTFAIKSGDIDGSGSVTDVDTTMYRQYKAGGYIAAANVLADIDAAWAVAGAMSEYAFAVPTDNTYFLRAVADVNGDGSESVTDVFMLAAAQLDANSYAAIEDGAVAIKLTSADSKAFQISGAPTAVTVAGEATAAYSYADGTLTLTTALTSGQKIVITVGRVKYVYTAA